MSGEGEPPMNIGVEHGTTLDPDQGRTPGTRAEEVVARLGDQYWRKRYGGQDAFRCLLRTILSQNTSDEISHPAFEQLLERFDDDDLASNLVGARREAIAESIRSAGLYNQKATVIQSSAQRILDDFGGSAAFDRFVRESNAEDVRSTLLEFDGVGPKTADCVLLFAAGRPGVFPVDTHVHRITRRLGLTPPDADPEEVRAILEGKPSTIDRPDAERWGANMIPPEHCGFAHTAMIQFGREYCTARRPACLDGPDACPMVDLCERVGIDPETGAVVDPVETVDR